MTSDENDDPAPAERARRQRTRFPPPVDDPEPPAPSDPEPDLPGAVFMVPDAFWGFEVVDREDHPGLCVLHQAGQGNVVLLKGCSSEAALSRRDAVCVEPTVANGLTRTTAFDLTPRRRRTRRVRLFFANRYLGHLEVERLDAILHELARLFPNS